ncbi:MAG: hypothetical protein KAW17_06660 [Candidatus Eisenbacteria sp.]|nr:hypothetical protein [Candidatus Eisenbacteria bacterium]
MPSATEKSLPSCSDADIPEIDDLEAYSTAHIRRFCEMMESIISKNEAKRQSEQMAASSEDTTGER